MAVGLSSSAIIQVWEIGAPRGPVDRAIAILWADEPNDGEEFAALPIAERNRKLLAVRQATFGEKLNCMTMCPDCGELLEFVLSAEHLREKLQPADTEVIERGPYRIEFRALDSRDLAAAVDCESLEAATDLLRTRAINITRIDGATQRAVLPKKLRSEIDARVEERETSTEARLTFDCAACGTTWTAPLDVAVFVWTEIEAAAHRLLADIAELAHAYGWSETEIHRMSEQRRQTYLQLARK